MIRKVLLFSPDVAGNQICNHPINLRIVSVHFDLNTTKCAQSALAHHSDRLLVIILRDLQKILWHLLKRLFSIPQC